MELKTIIESKFNLKVNDAKLFGEGYDSKAYLINNEYIFKIKYSANIKKGYKKEKAIYDFLNKNLKTSVEIPKIEFSYISDDMEILGYKEIKGKFLSPETYKNMSEIEKINLKKDIAQFLKKLHELNYDDIKEYKIDNKENVINEYELLKSTIYNSLTQDEQKYIENFMTKLKNTNVFNGKKCLCHNDFSCNHLLLDANNKLTGVIDFGDSGIIDEYCDFIYLLEDSEEEIGRNFGEEIIDIYGDIDKNKAIEYQDIVEEYYPIETIVYGIKNKNEKFIKKGREEILRRV